MKSIEIDEELYQFIAGKTEFIGESASSILRRLLMLENIEQCSANNETVDSQLVPEHKTQPEPVLDELIEKKSDSVFDYINREELATQRGAVGRFLLILAALYRVHSAQFNHVCDIRGRDRLYFAQSEEALAKSGSSTKPRQIPDSPFWVITNSNTTRKKMMLTEVAISLGYTADEAEQIRELL